MLRRAFGLLWREELEGLEGVYLDEVAIVEKTSEDAEYWEGGYGEQAFDPDMEVKLWVESLRLTGLSE